MIERNAGRRKGPHMEKNCVEHFNDFCEKDSWLLVNLVNVTEFIFSCLEHKLLWKNHS
jgi:hypothetical protein